MAALGYVYDPFYLEHGVDGHPERPGRLRAIMSHLHDSGLIYSLAAIPARDATEEEILLVHTSEMLARVREARPTGVSWLDADTYLVPESYEVAVRAAGGCLAALEAVNAGDVSAAFCLLRPPGHHATPSQSMGFCLFNNIAIAAGYGLERLGLQRVAIVDFDVHHGNGTQDCFHSDERVLFFSSHQYPFYPGTGHWRERGRGNIINVPLPPSEGDDAYMAAYREVCAPALRRFRPQIILVSAGFDAHFADPLAQMQVSCHGYYEIAALLRDLAAELCDGRILFTLEGGYHEVALPWSVHACIDALLGNDFTPDPLGIAPREAEGDVRNVLASVKEAHNISN